MKKLGIGLSSLLITIFNFEICFAEQITGPGTNLAPFVVPNSENSDIDFYSIVTAADGEPMFDGYFHTGSADGTAAYDNGDGTFTILVNHEIPYIPTITVPFPLSAQFLPMRTGYECSLMAGRVLMLQNGWSTGPTTQPIL